MPSLFLFLAHGLTIPSLKYTSELLCYINIEKSQYKLNALLSFILEHLAAGSIINLKTQPQAHDPSTRTLLFFLKKWFLIQHHHTRERSYRLVQGTA